jgi:transposase
LLRLWKEKRLVSRRLLAYDTTNFYTYIASTNTRNHLAQRGHNKQGRHNLRQVGLSYVLDGENGLSLCHHVYPGNLADSEEFTTTLSRITTLLDHHQIPRQTVTLVVDKGSAALANTVALQEARLGWISALPWNQAPREWREQPVEQLHSLTTSLSRVMQSLRRLASEWNKPQARWQEDQVRRKIQGWLSAQFLDELVRYQLDTHAGRLRLQFDVDQNAFSKLLTQRLGRTVLLTNRMDWTAEQVVAGYAGQQQVERVFRGLKDGDWRGWGPMHYWTDRKIRIHAFYCMLGISLLQYVHKQAQNAWPDLSIERLLEELEQIKQFALLYLSQGDKGPPRAAYVLSRQTLVQQALLKTLDLEPSHCSTQRG